MGQWRPNPMQVPQAPPMGRTMPPPPLPPRPGGTSAGPAPFAGPAPAGGPMGPGMTMPMGPGGGAPGATGGGAPGGGFFGQPQPYQIPPKPMQPQPPQGQPYQMQQQGILGAGQDPMAGMNWLTQHLPQWMQQRGMGFCQAANFIQQNPNSPLAQQWAHSGFGQPYGGAMPPHPYPGPGGGIYAGPDRNGPPVFRQPQPYGGAPQGNMPAPPGVSWG